MNNHYCARLFICSTSDEISAQCRSIRDDTSNIYYSALGKHNKLKMINRASTGLRTFYSACTTSINSNRKNNKQF